MAHAMSDNHKEILRKNRSYIIKNMDETSLNDILDDLLATEENVLTSQMVETIQAEPVLASKVRKFLDTLPRRGAKAFQRFCESLRNNANTHIAAQLEPEGGIHNQGNSGAVQATSKYGTDQAESGSEASWAVPDDWPYKGDKKDVKVVLCDSSNSAIKRQYADSKNVYEMRRKPRGRALIINNELFDGMARRGGTNVDKDDIEKLFTQLFFSVDVKENLNGQEIRDVVQRESQNKTHWKADCFVMVIMSHGEKNGVCGVDGGTVSVEEIVRPFDGQKCPGLKGKPKMFFIQACRGLDVDTGISSLKGGKDPVGGKGTSRTDGGVSIDTLSDEFGELAVETVTDTVTVAEEEPHPSQADFFIANSTTDNMKSFRQTETGSWFIQALVEVFQNTCRDDDINSLMTKVAALMSCGVAKYREKGVLGEFKTVPESRTSLTKKLFFFPGLAGQL